MTDVVLVYAAAAIAVLALVVLGRAVAGPTMQDRVVAVNVLGTSTVVIISLLSAGLGRPSYLDIALVYALLNFVLSIAVAKYTIQRGEVL
ncbi:MAG: cation:proton antiporter [Halobacteriales archaeon]